MPEFSSSDFSDFDAFRACLRHWDTDPVQLDAGPLYLRWSELRLESFSLASLSVNRRVADASAVDPDWVNFVVTRRPQAWCGMQVQRGSLIVGVGGREQRATLSEGFGSVEMTASQDLLLQMGVLREPVDARAFPPERSVIPLTPAVFAGFERLGDLLEDGSGSRISESRAKRLQRSAVDLLKRSLGHCEHPSIRRVPRYELARAALEMVDERGERRLEAREIAKKLGVTPRALEYAFNDSLGVPPARYLLARRLGRARQAILAESGANITSVAARLGFENPGRFSGQYRRLFVELPSETRSHREARSHQKRQADPTSTA